MPRVGSTREEQSNAGSQFEVSPGRYEIIAAKAGNHQIQAYPVDCGFYLTFQPLDKNWKATGDESLEEFFSFGKAEKFHPAKGAAQDFGDKGDQGDKADAEGEFVIAADRGPAKNARISIFNNSLEDHGVKKSLLDGTAANLIGLKAEFTRFMMPKSANSKKDEPPTCLIVGSNGAVAGGKIEVYPKAMTNGAGGGAAGAKGKATAAAGKPAAAAKAGAEAEAEAGSETAAGSVGGGADEIEGKAIQVLAAIGAGQAAAKQYSFARGRIAARTNIVCTNLIADGAIETGDVKGIVKLIGQKAWLDRQAVEALDWTVSGDTFTVSKD
jgi:hypothetical protein